MSPTYPLPVGYFSGGSHVPDGNLEAIINDLGAKTTATALLDPTADQKAALAGTEGTPSASNPYVTTEDGRFIRDGAPELDRLNIAGGAAMLAAGGDITLVGRDLLQGQTFDAITITQGAASVALHAMKPGDSAITVQVIAGSGALGVTYSPSTKACVITLAAGGSTDDAIATAINANAAQTNGHIRAISATGGTFTAAAAAAPMTGGTGNYAQNKVMAGGLEALPANTTGITAAAKWSNTGIVCTTQAVGAATDVATIAVQSNGAWTQALSTILG